MVRIGGVTIQFIKYLAIGTIERFVTSLYRSLQFKLTTLGGLNITAFRVNIRVVDTLPVKNGLPSATIYDNGDTALLHTIVCSTYITGRQSEFYRIGTSLVGHIIIGIVGVIVGHSTLAHSQQTGQKKQVS